MLSKFGDIWIGSAYIYTSIWSGSCSEEGPLFRSASPRSLYVTAYGTPWLKMRMSALSVHGVWSFEVSTCPFALTPTLSHRGGQRLCDKIE